MIRPFAQSGVMVAERLRQSEIGAAPYVQSDGDPLPAIIFGAALLAAAALAVLYELRRRWRRRSRIRVSGQR